jgi:hypothetical protein
MGPEPALLMSIENLRKIWSQATRHERDAALASYWKYNLLCSDMGRKHGYNVDIAAAVFAALSPNNDYHGNLRDAANLMAAARAGKTLAEFNVSTYGQNKRKAWNIVRGFIKPLDAIKADKTRNFYMNVAHPDDPAWVTIDGHMYNMWNAKRVNLVGLRSQKTLYKVVADGVREMALEVDLIPNQVQAILWTTWRRLHNIQTTQQTMFWDQEYHVAKIDPFKPNEKTNVQKRPGNPVVAPTQPRAPRKPIRLPVKPPVQPGLAPQYELQYP